MWIEMSSMCACLKQPHSMQLGRNNNAMWRVISNRDQLSPTYNGALTSARAQKVKFTLHDNFNIITPRKYEVKYHVTQVCNQKQLRTKQANNNKLGCIFPGQAFVYVKRHLLASLMEYFLNCTCPCSFLFSSTHSSLSQGSMGIIPKLQQNF